MNRHYLDRNWKFCFRYEESMKDTPMEGGSEISLPHSVCETPLHYFDESCYQTVSCYQRMIPADPSWKGKRILLTFEGAAHRADVFLNGSLLCTHACGYTAFTVDLTDALSYDSDNLLTVRLDSRESLDQPPFGFVIDYMTYGGLYRDVYLEIKDPVYMEDIFLKPKLTGRPRTIGISRKELMKMRLPAELTTEIQLSDEAKKCAKERRLSIRQSLSGKVISEQPLGEDGHTTTLAGEVPLWDINNPMRCEVITELLVDGTVTDCSRTMVGFREAQFHKNGFYLNGRKVKIRGLNRHQSYPYVGYAMPESMQRMDASILKNELSLNAVRTSHYPQSQDFIDECDKIGLLVFTEIPGWQHIGGEEWKNQAVENTKEMVVQYRNHPSIILWGVRINESQDDDELYRRTNETAHRYDPTRQTGGVRAGKKMSLLEDVYTYNDFSHDGTNEGCEPKSKVTPDPEKPYMITEYNGHMFPTKTFDCEEHLLAHAMRHARVLDAVAGETDIAGSFGWCMFDYNTHKDFGSGDRICYHGVMDMFRNPKIAAKIYAAQSIRRPVLALTSSMDIGEHPASVRGDIYIITNADSVRMYKNGRFIKEYFPQDSPFKNLRHGPIPVDDLIGDEMIEKEGFSKRQNELVKTCLNEVAIHGYKITGKVAAAAAQLMALYHMNMSQATGLFQKYIGDWGGESMEYRFDAIIGGKVAASVVKAPMRRMSLECDVSSELLTEGRTYDVAEIRLAMCDEHHNVLPFYGESVTIDVKGPLQVIGPKNQTALSGGLGGVYVRTVGEEGDASVTMTAPGADPITVDFHISRDPSAEDV